MSSRARRAGRRALVVRCVLLPALGYILYLFLVVFRLGPLLEGQRLSHVFVGAVQLEATLWGALAFLVVGPMIGYLRTRRDWHLALWHDAWAKRLADWRPGEPSAMPPGDPADAEHPIDEELDRLLETILQRADRVAEKKERRIQGMRALLNRAEEGVAIVGPEGELEFVNEAAQAFYNLQPLPSKRKKRRKQNRRLLNEIRDDAVTQLVERVRQSGEAAETSYKQGSDLGRMLHARCYRMPEPSNELLLVFRDISKQHQLENMRREFVANVGHELRTPLAAIKGYLETLLDDGLEDPATIRHFLGIIQRNTIRLEALVTDLLELSRLDAHDNRPQELERVAIAEIMLRPLEVASQRAEERGIALSVELPPDLPFVLGKRGPLEQVFINLITNALQYSDSGTAVAIRAHTEQDHVLVEVSDRGIGIEPEHHERIFERFYRVDRDRSRAAGGTGLGLSIVKHIVQQCGGSVGLQSERGHGSTFTVRLLRAELLA